MTGEGVPHPCQYCISDARYSKCTSVREARVCDNRTQDCPATGAGHSQGPYGMKGEWQCQYCGLPSLDIDPRFPAAVYEHDISHEVTFPTGPAMGTRVNEIQAKLSMIEVGGCTCGTKTPELKHHNERCHFRLASEISELLRGMP